MNSDQLRALEAVVRTGSFERAASELHVTPSAVSQRIKALEASAGRVLVHRSVPAVATEAGAPLVRLAGQWALLEADARAALGDAGPSVLTVGVNADSLATWFVDVLRAAASWDDTLLRLIVEDQDHSFRLLRAGEVVGTVTSEATPVAGCRLERLGLMRYVPVCTPALAARFGGAGAPDWARLRVVVFNDKDDLQAGVLRELGVGEAPPAVVVPSSQGFADAVRAGLGWGMVPEGQLGDDLESGRLVRLPAPDREVPLYWQVWKLGSPRLDRLTEAVRAASSGLARS